MKFIELFGGIGGFRLGLEQASDKFESVWYNDFDKYAVSVYNKNFGEKHEAKNIREIKCEEIPENDLLTAGFPCQSFSIAGRRKGFEDTRGTLFFEIARILDSKRPKHLFLENVKGLVNHDSGKTFRVIIQTLQELGYDVEWGVVNSRYFGVPQNRERVFIIGSLREMRGGKVFPIKQDAGKVQRVFGKQKYYGKHQTEAIQPLDGVCGSLTATDYKQPKQILVNQEPTIYNRKGFDSRSKGFMESKISPTLSTKMGTGGNNVPMILGKVITPEHFFEKGKRNLVYKQHRAGEWREFNDSPTLKGDNNVPMILGKVIKKGDLKKAGNLTIISKKRVHETPIEINKYLKECKNMTNKEIAKELELPITQVEHYFRTDNSRAIPSPKIWIKLKDLFGFDDKYDKIVCDEYEKEVTYEQTRRVYSSEGISPTLNTIQEPTIYDSCLRRLTPIECERLQGFPDNWTKEGLVKNEIVNVSDTQRYKQLGNAVTVNVIKKIGQKLLTKT